MRIEKARARGFSTIELLITLAVLMLLMAFAVVGVARTRERVRLADGARGFGNYLEKARTDSVRRHADAAAQAGVQVLNATTYRVRFDQNNDGALAATEFLDVTLPTGVTFVTNPAPAAASYDWRGRLAAPVTYTLQNSTGTTTLNITTAGDVTINSTAAVPAAASTPYPTPTPTPVPTPTPTPAPTNLNGCSVMPSPSSLTVRKSGKTSGSVFVTGSNYGNPDTVTLTFDSTLLKVSLSPAGTLLTPGYTFTAAANTMTTFSVVDIKGANTNYTSPVTFISSCGSSDVAVTVTQ